uniref:NADH dehydrogenase subunit 4 n=1 Tax=Hylurgus ligniperda TaxID=167147 RepID=UPI00279A2C0B|nr:NADH dehydrogenase subunit 4 [Hylurgus ligniperda]WGL40352.1 NADH dehydrogenase subunit 4 [Hylurgus ligniperda]WKD83328.1 NADH dehydrogenase subunit 4 [Hylurgus ligniperda]
MMMFILSLLFLIFMSYILSFWMFSYIFSLLMLMLMIKIDFSGMFNISYFLGFDLLSYTLICLSIWICMLMLIASKGIYMNKFYTKLFMLNIMILLLSLVLTFSSLNLFNFYLFFEISLVPIFILILGWGSQPERMGAGFYLLFYTLMVSLPVMIVLFYLNMKLDSLEFYFLKEYKSNLLMYICMNMVFFVKIPMFVIHLWLPKAHVEAPISGSMILAGVMLKLGGYGLFRVMKLFIDFGMKINNFIIIISLIGGIFISMICLRQSDMKLLIAYSSISHMGMILAGILTLNLWGFWGGLALMLAHGLSSSGLFCLANILYERTHSRSLFLNKGFMNLLPNLSLWWFLLCSSSMSAPPSFNLLGEILLINSLVYYSKFMMVCLFFLVFYSAVYSLFLYSFSQHGKICSSMFSFKMGESREFLLLFLHWVPLNFLFLKSELLIWI